MSTNVTKMRVKGVVYTLNGKLYSSTGNNTDGSMTQSAITSELTDAKDMAESALAIAEQVREEGMTTIEGNVTNNPDEEDITTIINSQTNLGELKLKDRAYIPVENAKGYVILRNNKTLAQQITQENTIYEVRYNFDLGEDTITIPEGSELRFNGGKFSNGLLKVTNSGRVSDGIFSNVIVYYNKSIVVENCIFNNPNKISAIKKQLLDTDYANHIGDAIIRNNTLANIGTELTNGESSVFGIYVDFTNNSIIENNTINAVGNINIVHGKAVAAIAVGYIHNNSTNPSDIVNTNITIRNNNIKTLIRPETTAAESGECHAIMLQMCDGVTIENNFIENTTTLCGFDSEFIYTKCDNININNNKLLGTCGGEAAIVCKPFTFYVNGTQTTDINHVTICNNLIEGYFYSCLQLYGTSFVNNNTLTNYNKQYIISIQAAEKDGYTVDVLNNTLLVDRNEAAIGYISGNGRHTVSILDTIPNKTTTSTFNFVNNKVTLKGTISSGNAMFGFRGLKNYKVNIEDCTLVPGANDYNYIFSFDNHTASSVSGFNDIDLVMKNCTILNTTQQEGQTVAPRINRIFTFNNNNNDIYNNVNITIDNFKSLKNATYFMYDVHALGGGVLRLKDIDVTCGYLIERTNFSKVIIEGDIKTFSNALIRYDSILNSPNDDPSLNSPYNPEIVLSNAHIVAPQFIYDTTITYPFGYKFDASDCLFECGGNTGAYEVLKNTTSAYFERNTFVTKSTSITMKSPALNTNNNIVKSIRSGKETMFDVNISRTGVSKFNVIPQYYNGTTWINSDSIDMTNVSTVKGTTVQREALTLSATNEGLRYYDTTLKKYVLWNGTEWTNLDGTQLT